MRNERPSFFWERNRGFGVSCRLNGLEEESVAKQIGALLGLAFAISWAIWITATRFGTGPSSGECVLAFGTVGPACGGAGLARVLPSATTTAIFAVPRQHSCVAAMGGCGV
jgi:hypothetical protein